MNFYVTDSINPQGENKRGVYLIKNSWDDWFKYRTTYSVWLSKLGEESDCGLTNIGAVKIGDIDDSKPFKTLPSEFTHLDDTFFSLGTDEAFYIELATTFSQYREEILVGLNDVALNETLYDKYRYNDVFHESLARDISFTTIERRFNRLANGNAELTNYKFSFEKKFENNSEVNLDFEVIQRQLPPTNVHCLIGRNGVGKSLLLTSMIESLINKNDEFEFYDEAEDYSSGFSNLLSINFSTFEKKKIYEDNSNGADGIIYHHIGSQMYKENESGKSELVNMTHDDLERLFVQSVTQCILRKPKRWTQCVNRLNTDPVFERIGVTQLIKNFRDSQEEEYKDQARKLFERLSSGHKIVLLSICKLVELSEEKTLLIMDEPEMHLHPPLLSSFIRSVSYLLRMVNGVAIIATHSPIVLQEIPSSCIWRLDKIGEILKAERFSFPTFGENISTLTREVFGYEVSKSGFNNILESVVAHYSESSYKEIDDNIFRNELGIEALNILRILVSKREDEK